jgi:hypothetical protein
MFKKYVFICALMSALSFKAYALEKEGKATLPVKGTLLSTVTDKERLAARKAALNDAWKNYINDSNINSISRVKSFDENKAEVEQKLDKCVTAPTDCEFFSKIDFVSEKVDKDLKTITVYLIVNVNDQRITAFLNSRSAAGKKGAEPGSYFAFLFLQRNVIMNKQSNEAGSDTQVRDKAKFAGDSAGSRDAANTVNQSLVQAGFQSMDFKDIADACNNTSIYDEAVATYQQEGTVKNFADMAKFIKACGKEQDIDFKYFAIAEAESTAPVKDRGKQVIVTKLSIRLTSIVKAIPQNIAVSIPMQIAGEGTDSITATSNGLIQAGTAAARVIIDTMNEKKLK